MAQKPDLTGVPPWGHSVFDGMDQLDTRVTRVQTTTARHTGVLDGHRKVLADHAARLAQLEQSGVNTGDIGMQLRAALAYIATLEGGGATPMTVAQAAEIHYERLAPELRRIEAKADQALGEVGELRNVVLGIQGPAVAVAQTTADTALRTAQQAMACAEGAQTVSARALATASSTSGGDQGSPMFAIAIMFIGLLIWLGLMIFDPADIPNYEWVVYLGFSGIVTFLLALFFAEPIRMMVTSTTSAHVEVSPAPTAPPAVVPTPEPVYATQPVAIAPAPVLSTPPPLAYQVAQQPVPLPAPNGVNAAAAAYANN